MIGIIDYGMGNLHSVQNALVKLELDSIISDDPKVLESADRLILPGVGAFKDMMDHLKDKKLDVFLKQQQKKGTPILGICLGMQAFFTRSFEKGEHEGLGFLAGDVVPMDPEGVCIPQIGWNALAFGENEPGSLLKVLYSKDDAGTKEKTKPVHFYFDHSYMARGIEPEVLAASVEHGKNTVAAIVIKDNLMGVQGHPEKSGEEGLKLLKYFGDSFYADHSSH